MAAQSHTGAAPRPGSRFGPYFANLEADRNAAADRSDARRTAFEAIALLRAGTVRPAAATPEARAEKARLASIEAAHDAAVERNLAARAADRRREAEAAQAKIDAAKRCAQIDEMWARAHAKI